MLETGQCCGACKHFHVVLYVDGRNGYTIGKCAYHKALISDLNSTVYARPIFKPKRADEGTNCPYWEAKK